MALKLMYITNRPDVALIAEKYGVDRIWIDLETLGKEERQKGMNTVKSNHTVDDVRKIKPLLSTSEMLVRVNPWNENSEKEIEDAVTAGADIIMLPMWKSAAEVTKFLSVVDGRCKAQFTSEIPGYKEYAEAAATVFADYFKGKDNAPELIIEPGSAVVGDCMKFVGTVKTIKNVRGKYFASVLGSQKNISMTGLNPPMEVVHMSDGEMYENLDMVGFTCIEGDVLYKNYTGKFAVGDAIVISNCGSYSLVMKALLYIQV